jgi:hypothetical protein
MKRNKSVLPRLQLEQLESRETPAGVVDVSFLNNTICFIGDNDAAGNQVKVTATGGNQFLIEGLTGTTFTLGGKNVGNTIDTGSLPAGIVFNFLNNGTTKIKVDLKDGPDRFEYDGFSNGLDPRNFGDVTIDTGAGDDTVIVRQICTKNFVILSKTPLAGTDNDDISVFAGGKFDFDGDTVLEEYKGCIKGFVRASTATGADFFRCSCTCPSFIEWNTVDCGDRFIIGSGSRIGGQVRMTTPSGMVGSFFDIFPDVDIAGGLGIAANNCPVTVNVANANIGGSVNIKSKGGECHFNGTRFGGSCHVDLRGTTPTLFRCIGSTFLSSVTAYLGDGGCGPGGHRIENAYIAGACQLFGGAGVEVVRLLTSTIVGKYSCSLFGGADRHFVDGCNFCSDVRIDSGKGGNGSTAAPDTFRNSEVVGTLKVFAFDEGAAPFSFDVENGEFGGLQYSSMLKECEVQLQDIKTNNASIECFGAMDINLENFEGVSFNLLAFGGLKLAALNTEMKTFVAQGMLGGTTEMRATLSRFRDGLKFHATGNGTAGSSSTVELNNVSTSGSIDISTKGFANDTATLTNVKAGKDISYRSEGIKIGGSTFDATASAGGKVTASATAHATGRVTFTNSDICGGLTIQNTGNGAAGSNATVSLDNTKVCGDTRVELKKAETTATTIANAVLAKSANVSTDDGKDNVVFRNTTVYGPLNIATFGEDDTIEILEDGLYYGLVKIRSGGTTIRDRDTVRMNGVARNLSFLNGWSVDTGADNDIFAIDTAYISGMNISTLELYMRSGFDQATLRNLFVSNLVVLPTFDGGADNDTIDWQNNGNQLPAGTTPVGFETQN